MELLMGILMYVFGIISMFGVPAAVIVCFFVFLVKYKRCSPEEAERKKLLKSCCLIFGIIGGVFIISTVAVVLLLSASIAYM